MKKLILGLLAVMSLGVVAFAATAQASEYLCNGKAEACKVLGFNLAAFVLEDRGVPASVSCPIEGVKSEGSVSGSTGEVTAATLAGCTPSATALNLKEEAVTNGCGTVNSVEAIDLPWKTPISEGASNDWWILIEKGTTTQPGYAITCTTGGIKITDKCTTSASGEDLLVLSEDLAAEGSEPALLTTIFSTSLLKANEAATCSLGGVEQGFTSGEILEEGWTGTAAEALAIN
jgi:hypothetical protein